MLRLDSYPAQNSAAQRGFPAASSGPPLVSCMLQSGVLPAQHSLAVWVGGIRQPCEWEDQHMVSRWQCAAEVEMEIHLLHAGRTLKAWRGWWQGDTTIVHSGTLSLQVWCAGLVQPPMRAIAPPVPSPAFLSGTLAQHNGVASALAPSATAVLEWPSLAHASPVASALHAEERTRQLAAEEDLWSEEEEEEPGTEEAQGEDLWEASETQEEEEPGAEEAQEGERDKEETERDEERAGTREGPAFPPVLDPSMPALTPVPSVPTGTMIAALHVAPASSPDEHERLMQRLASRLGTLPANTILVDLRRHPPTPRSTHARRAASRSAASGLSLGLTKEVLRAQYGARYWERGGLILTVLRLTVTHPSRRSRVVRDPQAEALNELVLALTSGFSLLLLESLADYAESERAAVLTELRQRVPGVTIGACT